MGFGVLPPFKIILIVASQVVFYMPGEEIIRKVFERLQILAFYLRLDGLYLCLLVLR
jgi:hypothetical protein